MSNPMTAVDTHNAETLARKLLADDTGVTNDRERQLSTFTLALLAEVARLRVERDEALRGVRELWAIANDAAVALAEYADDEEEMADVVARLAELKPTKEKES